MTLRIQDPSFQESLSLHEALIEACNDAELGAGTFAFATLDGVKLFMEDTAFIEFISEGSFQVLVGMDAITDRRAVEKLCELNDQLDGLNVTAFLHNGRNLFHPKLCWFRNPDGSGRLVVGSGNLTIGGLRNNWEMFAVQKLTETETDSIERTWTNWLDCNQERIHPITDDAVNARAIRNVRATRQVKRVLEEAEEEVAAEAAAAAVEQLEVDDQDPWRYVGDDRVLVAQIPRASDRWNQANFDKHNFENFFGAQAGNNTHRILLRSVSVPGGIGDIESRPSVSVKSKNYRFELEAASGLDYPDDGPPVGIFIEVGRRMFLYTLVMPDNTYYDQVDDFLENNWIGRADRMKRINTTVESLRENCPDLPFWDEN
jgi:hypothetical protein